LLGRYYGLTYRAGLPTGAPANRSAGEINQPAMVVDVLMVPCPDPGSTPGVSTNFMESIVLLILAIVFVYLLLSAKKITRGVNRSHRNLVNKIKDHYR